MTIQIRPATERQVNRLNFWLIAITLAVTLVYGGWLVYEGW